MFKLQGERDQDEGQPVIVESVGAMLLMAMVAPDGAEPPPAQRRSPQLVVRKQVIIRSLRANAGMPKMRGAILWKEARGVKCLPVQSIAGAALIGQNSVDFILRNGTRIRARLNAACPALDYYYGFYLSPPPDGMICVDRDSLRSRMGRECGIDRLRLLKPVRRR